MVDLDALAERRARALNQDESRWREIIWEPGFQKLTQSMTDGEVEDFISLCPSTEHFGALVAQLEREGADLPPFTRLLEAAKRAGQAPPDFVRSLK